MTRIAVIEDDLPTSNQLAGWIRSAKSGIVIDQWFTRDEAEAALAREHYDAVVLDIELGRERHAGVALINAINKLRQGTPVLVWATCAFTEPLYNYTFTLADGSWPYSNSHCLVLTGYDEDNYYFADPMQEITEIDRDTFALRYEELGSHAVVITQ